MNKSQITLAAVGGVAVVGALALGYFIWDASSVRSENAEALDSAVSFAEGIVRKLPMKPGAKEFALYAGNAAAFDAWRTNAEHFVSRGDYLYENLTRAMMQQKIKGDAAALSRRGGCLDGAFVKPDFGFGFPNYVTGSDLPPANELKRLEREWSDVTKVLKMLSNCGSNEVGVVDIRMGAVAAAEPKEEAPTTKKGKKAKKPVKKASEETQGPKTEVTRFAVDVMTRPSVLVKALNAFATDERFIVVENCTFKRERDEIAEKLGGGDGKRTQSEATGGRRGRRRGGAAQAAKAEAGDDKGGVVTDPANAPLLKVTMTFSVYDFGTLDSDASEGEGSKVKGEGAEVK